jgi:hypothetical protein
MIRLLPIKGGSCALTHFFFPFFLVVVVGSGRNIWTVFGFFQLDSALSAIV